MLGKLLKNEIKNSARYILSIYAAVAVAVAIMGLSLLTKLTWLGVISCFALYTIGIVAIIITLVSVIKNFNDTLYGRQGYLSFTLPVKCRDLLFSKVLISFMWIIVSYVIMAAIFMLIFLYAKFKSNGTLDSVVDAIQMSGMLDMFPSAGMMIKFLIIMAMLILMIILTYVGYVYFTVTLANTRPLQNHPKLYGFLIFVALFVFSNIISTKLTQVFPLALHVSTTSVYISFQSMENAGEALFSYGIGGTIFTAIVALGLLFLTGYIMEHKVNIK